MVGCRYAAGTDVTARFPELEGIGQATRDALVEVVPATVAAAGE